MAISDDLFRAILAMDVYNRGYNAGIGDPVTGLAGTQIGNATINSNLNTTGWEAASFFAQSYTWAGKTVISYRGRMFCRGWTLLPRSAMVDGPDHRTSPRP